MAGITPDSPKHMKEPARSGRKFGSENLSHNETMIETMPNTTTTDR